MGVRRSLVPLVVLGAVSAGVLSGCASSASGGAASSGTERSGSGSGATSAAGSSVNVVASTNVYGDIAKQIGGSRVKVTSIIADPDQDPHSYEADSRTQLELSKADIVIENGGGYDDFVGRMLQAAGTSPTTINVVEVSGKSAPAGGELNEHVWYDLPTVGALARELVEDLSDRDPADAATFRRNAAAFTTELKRLEATEASIKTAHSGEGVAITEPVPLYLLEACGLVNRTPAPFSEAVEEGDDVPVRVLNQTLQLFSGKSVKLLAYNEQTSDAATQQVLSAAKRDGVAVVPVTETLPAGKSYVSWMAGNLAAVRSALG